MKEFEKIGKPMPYRTPEGFFAQQAAELQQAADRIVSAGKLSQRLQPLRPLIWMGGIAAALLVVLLLRWGDLTPKAAETAYHEPLYAYHESMSSDELEGWVEYYEADLFLIE